MARDTISTTSFGGLVTIDTALAVVTKVIVTVASSITRPPTPITLVVELLILVVCLKKFTYYTKNLKIFYEKCITCKKFYL